MYYVLRSTLCIVYNIQYAVCSMQQTVYSIQQAVYDIYSEDEYPHYLKISISNYSDININIVIRNILGTKNYEMQTISFIGYDLIISNSELKEKLKEVIDGILNFIPEERKVKILRKLIEKFKILKTYNKNSIYFLIKY